MDAVLDDAVAALGRGYLEPAIPALVATRADPESRALRVEALARAAAGLTGGIEALIERDRVNPDLWLWLGRARIEEAWLIKPDVRARAVQADRMRVFQQAMESARAPLTAAARFLPADPVPWVCLLWLALALERPREEKDSLWAEAWRRHPGLYAAHVARLSTLSPGWGGTSQEMFDFARAAGAAAPPGDPLWALIPLAHFEHMSQERPGRSRAWISFDVQREISAASGRWLDGRGARPHPRVVEAHNAFGAAFYLADMRRPARGHLSRTGGRFSELPWSHLGDPAKEFHRACSRLNVITNG
ncbi:hypothetical protein Sme01_37790 [Sphaerisporangium melleum]|uniref:DUF4034 domain-containing protein n=1 Tax=Sphaerisporangium melleum TaxID=321316 RepID=A0A917RR56_9ACTN|nr:hypothetical protein GCM10007964_72560 [Sphaerisporangium melleum]GII71303.1 hypothetical protein Sme01_37790 [Sphaerisporangium melleum]